MSRVSDTANSRAAINYDNTAELVSLAGSSLSAESKGYGQLRGMGAPGLVSSLSTLPGDTGINLLDENYAISAGAEPPTAVTLIAGGQDASLVTGRMIKLGWKKNANRVLTGPSPLTGTGNAAAYAESMAKVQAGNSDVLFAGSSASLSQARTWSSGRPKSAAPGAPPQPHRHPPKHLTASQASQLTGLAASPRFLGERPSSSGPASSSRILHVGLVDLISGTAGRPGGLIE